MPRTGGWRKGGTLLLVTFLFIGAGCSGLLQGGDETSSPTPDVSTQTPTTTPSEASSGENIALGQVLPSEKSLPGGYTHIGDATNETSERTVLTRRFQYEGAQSETYPELLLVSVQRYGDNQSASESKAELISQTEDRYGESPRRVVTNNGTEITIFSVTTNGEHVSVFIAKIENHVLVTLAEDMTEYDDTVLYRGVTEAERTLK